MKNLTLFYQKNRICRELKRLYNLAGEKVPEYTLWNIKEIERVTGTSNQPTGEEILTSEWDV